MRTRSLIRFWKLIVGAGLLIFIMPLVGVVLEPIGQRHDRERYPQIGKSVDIGGRTLNIFCSGEGGPVVVFDTYGHMSGYSWSAIQSEVAKFNRACWYDRAAYGWSEPGPLPPTYQSVASDLHALLQATGVPPPFVLVGASEAALHIRVFHGHYPREVGGVVMVNALDVDAAGSTGVRGLACSAFPVLARVGLIRLAGLFQRPRTTASYGLNPEQQEELDFLSDNPTAVQGGEACAREESQEQVRASGTLGDLPLIVLASKERLPESIMQVQPGLARLSSRSRLVVLGDAVTIESIVGAVRDVVSSMAPAK